MRAGEDDGLRQVLEHVGEGRGGVGHRVGAVQHDEAVVVGVAVGDAVGDVGPPRGRHVAGVDGRRELEGVDLRVELLELGHTAEQVLEVEGLQGAGLRITVHADCAARVDQKDSALHQRKRLRCNFGAKIVIFSETFAIFAQNFKNKLKTL